MQKHGFRIAALFSMMVTAALPLRASIPSENAPTFKASDFLPEYVINNADYTISQVVPTSGLMGVFTLHTEFGDFECRGVEMLQIRLDELQALKQIEQLSRAKVFTDAAKGAVLAPVKVAVKIVSDPVGNVAEIPAGVERLFGRVIKGAGKVGKSIAKKAKELDEDQPSEKRPEEPSARQDPFGYNTTRNAWAQHFGVDPYTSNKVLAEKLSVLARITFGTDTLAGMGVGEVARIANRVTTVDKLVLTKTPSEVSEINAGTLAKMGVRKDAADALLENRWFTPTLQTRFVKALASMKGVKGPSSIVRLAGGIQSEEEARFLCRGVELLAYHHKKVGRLTAFHPMGRIPAAYAQNESLIVSGPVDVIAWTKTVAEYAPQWARKDVHPVLCTSGLITRQAREGFAACDWTVHLIDQPAATPLQ